MMAMMVQRSTVPSWRSIQQTIHASSSGGLGLGIRQPTVIKSHSHFPGQLSGQHKNDFHYNPLHWQMKISLLKSRSIFQQIMTFPGRFPLVLPTFPEWPVSILDCRPPKLSPRLGSCCPRCKHWRPAKPWQREGPVPCIFPKYETRFWFNGCS